MFPQPGFEDGPLRFNRIEVRRIRRKIFQRTPLAFDQRSGRRGLVKRRVVHHHDLARTQLGQEDLLQPRIEHQRVAIALKSHGGQQP